MPVLVDGREVSSGSEEWRHECEARYILRLPSLEQRRAWLADLERRQGKDAVDRLRQTMSELWRAR
jgi:hypothetical protein